MTGIDDGALERETLALVNGDGPCQPKRILAEDALYLGLYLVCLGIDGIVGVFPFLL